MTSMRHGLTEALNVEIDDFVQTDENTFRRVVNITRHDTDIPRLAFHFADHDVASMIADDHEDVAVLRAEATARL